MAYFAYWVPYVIGPCQEIWVALDWTEFDHVNHSTLVLSLVTRHGRATPLLWKSVRKYTLKGRRNRYEDELLLRFKEVLPQMVNSLVIMPGIRNVRNLYTNADLFRRVAASSNMRVNTDPPKLWGVSSFVAIAGFDRDESAVRTNRRSGYP